MLSAHYTAILHFHSGLRWLVLLSGLVLVSGCIVGRTRNLPFRSMGRSLSVIYVSLMDLQFLAGLTLYFASPIVRSFWNNPSEGMKTHDLRFFAMEHTTLMIAALALAHIGAARSRRATGDSAAYGTALKWGSASLLLILAGIPWWRPLCG
jgi:hypothetical protein